MADHAFVEWMEKRAAYASGNLVRFFGLGFNRAGPAEISLVIHRELRSERWHSDTIRFNAVPKPPAKEQIACDTINEIHFGSEKSSITNRQIVENSLLTNLDCYGERNWANEHWNKEFVPHLGRHGASTMLKSNDKEALEERATFVKKRQFVVNYPQEDHKHGIFQEVWRDEKEWFDTIEKAVKTKYGMI